MNNNNNNNKILKKKKKGWLFGIGDTWMNENT